MSSNQVTTVTLQSIIMLIRQIPLRNNKIVDGNLDDKFLIRSGYPFTSRRFRFDLTITARQIVVWLDNLLENEPESLENLDIFDVSNLRHFVETMRDNYEEDTDVRELLENPILKNWINIEN